MNGKQSGAVRSAWRNPGAALVMGMAVLWGCGTETARPVASPEEPLATTAQRVTYGGHTYVFSTTLRDTFLRWEDANYFCASMGMGLVTIDDPAEEAWVASQFGHYYSQGWWLGLNDVAVEGAWKWSGAQTSFIRWMSGEPSADDCAVYTANGWDAQYCNYFSPYACESIHPNAVQYNGNEYLFYPQAVTRERARTLCREEGYALATINSSAEDTWLKTQVPAGQSSWIGFSDVVREGTWRWADPSQVTYLGWGSGEPNDTNGVEDCAVNNAPASSMGPAGRWNDVSCEEHHPFICKRQPVPEGYEHVLYVVGLTASATRGTADYEFSLQGGEVLEIGTCGLPTAYAMGDTFLRLMGPDGLEVLANDDDCKGAGGSRIQYRVPPCAGGTYVVKAGCYGDMTCEARLVFRVIPAPQP